MQLIPKKARISSNNFLWSDYIESLKNRLLGLLEKNRGFYFKHKCTVCECRRCHASVWETKIKKYFSKHSWQIKIFKPDKIVFEDNYGK